MQVLGTSAGAAELVLNEETLNALIKAHDIRSEAELARLIGVNTTTLYRVREGKTVPSNAFIAGLKSAFPAASLDALLVVRRAA